jgi:two-component system OmpR family sensor kinase/two-component system sensor histidine kinase BaeS
MNRLWVRLTLAFTLVVLVAVGGVATLIQRTAETEFRQYITHSGMMASGSGVQQLLAYYQQAGSWEGVGSLLSEGVLIGRPPAGPWPEWRAFPRAVQDSLDVVLADSNGKIVFDSAGGDVGRRLRGSDRENALSIVDPEDDAVLGYLVIALPRREPLGILEQGFLDRLQNVLILGGALAVGLGLVASVVLSRGLTAPLQRLAAAARAVAGGNLKQKVEVEGSSELSDVGQAFNDMTAALERAEVLRQNLVADVAHELRTPLSVVQGNLRAILDGVYPLDPTEISRVYDETRLLGRLVDDLRELALADAGQLGLHLRPTDVARVIHQTIDHLAAGADAQRVILVARLPDRLPAVLADPDRLGQVLRNLVVNALRHTPSGGSVILSAVPRGDRTLHQKREVEISVADTGEGIAPADLPHVFERFWRVDPSRTRDDRLAGGTGLGLSVAQSLVEALGGRIWAESTLGQGSTFRFTLPVAPAAPHPA